MRIILRYKFHVNVNTLQSAVYVSLSIISLVRDVESSLVGFIHNFCAETGWKFRGIQGSKFAFVSSFPLGNHKTWFGCPRINLVVQVNVNLSSFLRQLKLLTVLLLFTRK